MRQGLFDRVTVQETSFFRHPGQFDALARPCAAGDRPGPVTIWSAASSNGQEPYSLAMRPRGAGPRRRVLATDVSSGRSTGPREAHYRERSCGVCHPNGGPVTWSRAGSGFDVRDEVRDLVTVRHHNLTRPLPDEIGRCPVVFCRNVLIYFTRDHAVKLLTRLAEQLPAGACVFFGYAETISHVSDLFEPVRVDGTFQYHRRRTVRLSAAPRPNTPAGRPPASTRTRDGRRTSAADERRDTRRAAAAKPKVAAKATGTPPTGQIPGEGATTGDDVGMLARQGELALSASDTTTAVAAFRKCAFLAPDEPIHHLHLGFALDAAGDRGAAARAWQAARAALDRLDPDADPDAGALALGGYHRDELVRLLDAKLGLLP